MKSSIKQLFVMMVVFLIVIVSWPIELAISSDFYLSSDNEDHLATSVMARYQDEFGNDLLPPYLVSRNQLGELYVAIDQSEQLPNYDFIATVGHPLGFHGEEDIEVIFIYRRRPTLTITPDQSRVQLGNVMTYTITVTNNAAGKIEDRYMVRVQFENRFSSLQQLEFIFDYLVTGETIIQFSMPIDQGERTGHKSIIATLIHPEHISHVESQVTTQIEISDVVTENPMTSLPPEVNETGRKRGEDHLEDERITPDIEGVQAKPTITMYGTFTYDLSIVGTIGVKLMELFLKS